MYLDPVDFPFVPALQAGWKAIEAEMAANVPSFFAWPQRELYGEGWDVFPIWFQGRRDETNAALCPVTTAAIEAIPGLRTGGFSLLKPGTHIKPHTGFGDGVLRCHLGLVAPDGCSMRVGDETRSWREGECLIFDDTTEHEVWHRGTEPRAVLLIDFAKEAHHA